MSQDLSLFLADLTPPTPMVGGGAKGVNPFENQQDTNKSFLLKLQRAMGGEPTKSASKSPDEAQLPVAALWQGMVESGKPLPDVLSEFSALTGIEFPEELLSEEIGNEAQVLRITDYLNQNFADLPLVDILPEGSEVSAQLLAQIASQSNGKEVAQQAATIGPAPHAADNAQQSRVLSAQEFISQRQGLLEAGAQAGRGAEAATAGAPVQAVAADTAINSAQTANRSTVALDSAASAAASEQGNAGTDDSNPKNQSQLTRDFFRQLAQSNNQFSFQQDAGGALSSGKASSGEGGSLMNMMSSFINGGKPGALSAAQSGQAPLSTSINMPLSDVRWGGELGNRITWMAQQKVQTAEIRINPERLGPIELRIEFNDDQARVVFSAQNGAVRDAIESSLPRLREMFTAQGLNLSDAQITDQSLAQDHRRGQFQNGGDESNSHSQPGAGDTDLSSDESMHTALDPHTLEPVVRSSIDLFA